MAKFPQSSGKGRNPRIISWDAIDKLLEEGAEGTQIAAYFGICEDTLYNAVKAEKGIGFSAYRAQKRASGDAALLDKSFSMAMNGDRAVMIFLLKNRLGYRDNPKEENSDKKEISELTIDELEAIVKEGKTE